MSLMILLVLARECESRKGDDVPEVNVVNCASRDVEMNDYNARRVLEYFYWCYEMGIEIEPGCRQGYDRAVAELLLSSARGFFRNSKFSAQRKAVVQRRVDELVDEMRGWAEEAELKRPLTRPPLAPLSTPSPFLFLTPAQTRRRVGVPRFPPPGPNRTFPLATIIGLYLLSLCLTLFLFGLLCRLLIRARRRDYITRYPLKECMRRDFYDDDEETPSLNLEDVVYPSREKRQEEPFPRFLN